MQLNLESHIYNTIYIYRVVQIKVYDRVCSLNQLIIRYYLLYYFSLPIYRQLFFSKHIFKINRKKLQRNEFCEIDASTRSQRGHDLNGCEFICNDFVNYSIN